MAPGFYGVLSFFLFSLTSVQAAKAQPVQPSITSPELRFDTTSTGPRRFIASHGRNTLIAGYADLGLEMWAYPIQILDDYRVAFRTAGSTSEVQGSTLLSRITYEPSQIVRTYIGADFVIKERLFAPLETCTLYVTYTVESRHAVDILVHFHPVLNLMWPAALGGQSFEWLAKANSYVLLEPTHRFAAYIGSPDITAHDDILNTAQASDNTQGPGFTIRANPGQAVTVVAGAHDPKERLEASTLAKLAAGLPGLIGQSRDHFRTLTDESLHIETPDPAVNEALAWSEVALDQAWVCNSDLGCGLVAGYGPSRRARRPQYDWFFAGDALVAIQALVDTGQYKRAKEALLFILKYQDAGTGMIWHELSQSAGQLDWVHQYPYMYVHVDITFQYLDVLNQYIETSGDKQFATDQSKSIQAAYQFCRSLVTTPDGLPRIPASKEGSNEQDRMSEESGLSAAWVVAASAYSTLAKLSGHVQASEESAKVADHARTSAADRYWDQGRSFWIDGFTDDGREVFSKSLHGDALIANHILSASERNSALDQLATADYQTDWGTRSTPSSATTYDPDSYAKGSVWAIGTAGMANTFWREHRPASAFPIWHSLIPWTSIDSAGHMNEVLAGDRYHPQIESVPEQTWSSAGLLSAAVRGLLGLQIEQFSDQVSFSPHLPPQWDSILVNHIRLSHGELSLSLHRVANGLELEAQNSGGPLTLIYQPAIPLGSRLTRSTLNDEVVSANVLSHDQDTHAALTVKLPNGTTRCTLNYTGGVEIEPLSVPVLVGEPSRGEKIISTIYDQSRFTITADVDTAEANALKLITNRSVASVQGASIRQQPDNSYLLTIPAGPAHHSDSPHYDRATIIVSLKPEGAYK